MTTVIEIALRDGHRDAERSHRRPGPSGRPPRACSTWRTPPSTRRSGSCWSPPPRGLVRLSYGAERRSRGPRRPCRRGILEAPARLDEVRRELDEYFDGRRSDFDVPIDWSLTRGFTGKVLRATARIRFGRTSTYAEVAGRAGSLRAVRAAGNALGANPIPVVVPCHRVLRTGGALGGYTGGVERKEFLLRLEGVLA